MNQSKPNKTRPKVKQKRTRYNKLIKNTSTSAATHLTNITLLSLNESDGHARRQAPRLSNVIFFIFLKSKIFHRWSWAPWASTIWAVGATRGPGSKLLEVYLPEELHDTVVRDDPPWPEPTHGCPTALTHQRWPRGPWWAGVSPAPWQSPLSPSPCFVLC
jgi:hypothetical protein